MELLRQVALPLDEASVLARIGAHGHQFEVICSPDTTRVAMTSTAMPSQTPNTTLKALLVLALCFGVLVLCALSFALGWMVGRRSQPVTQVISPAIPPALVEREARPAHPASSRES